MENKRMELYHENINQRKVGVDALMLDQVDFRAKQITRDRGTSGMIKGPVHQEYTVILNVHATEGPNI